MSDLDAGDWKDFDRLVKRLEFALRNAFLPNHFNWSCLMNMAAMSGQETHVYWHVHPSTFYRVSLKVVIRNSKGKILVNKEGSSDTWSLPGGGWDHGETEHQALARKLQEEVGYTGDFIAQPFKTAVFWLEYKQAWLLWIVYNVNTDNFDFIVGEESSEITFIDPKELEQATSFSERWIYENLS